MSVSSLVLMLLMLAVGGWGVVISRRWPALAVFGYLAALMFVPAWVMLPLGQLPRMALLIVLGLGLVAGLFGLDAVRPVIFDVVLLTFVAAIIVVGIVGLVTANTMYQMIMWWTLPYLVGRTLAARTSVALVYDTVAVLIGVVALLAIFEAATNHNYFVEWFASGSHWERLQYRGGRVRVEGAFGHSIALGAVLGMSVPMVWASRWRAWFRVVVLAAIGVAAMLTYSRIGMLTTMLALAASFVLLRKAMPARVRWTILGAGGVVAAVLVPTVIRVFDDGAAEAGKSADYRVFLLSLVPKLAVFGQATSPDVSIASVDNEFVLSGIRLGLLPLVVLLVFAAVGVVVAIRRPNPGLIAMVAVLPGLTSVAFITQFTAFFWFSVGLGVSHLAARAPALHPPAAGDRGPDDGDGPGDGPHGCDDEPGLYEPALQPEDDWPGPLAGDDEDFDDDGWQQYEPDQWVRGIPQVGEPYG